MNMISKINGHHNFWEQAVKAANFIINRVFTSSGNIIVKTHYECVMNKKPYLGFFRIFGCKAFVHIPKKHRE